MFAVLEIDFSQNWKHSAAFAALSSLWARNPAVRRRVNLPWRRGLLVPVTQSNLARLSTRAVQRRQLLVHPPLKLTLGPAKNTSLPSYLPAPTLVAMRRPHKSLLLRCVPKNLAMQNHLAALRVLNPAAV
jgi:hypothetical protein